MLTKEDFKVGDKVHYYPPHYHEGDKWENGIVKEIPEYSDTSIRVVYNCGDDWVNYQNYTSALTHVSDLKKGWRTK